MLKPDLASTTRWIAPLVFASMLGGSLAVGPLSAQAAAPSGGVTLDGWGGLHVFGNLTLNRAGAPYWSGFDIARSLTLRGDGSGGWMLDGWGGIHPFGSAAAVSAPAYWQGWDIARALVVTSRGPDGLLDGRQGYVLDGWGGIHPWGGAPSLTGQPYTPNQDVARGLEIHYGASGTPDGGWLMDWRGRTHPFGAAPPLPPINLPQAPIFQQLHGTATAGYVVPKFGVITAYGTGVSPDWSGYADWGTWDILRDIALINPTNPTTTNEPSSAAASNTYEQWLRPRGGVILDGLGGLHPFGGMPLDEGGAPYFSGWDIMRAVSVRGDGSGGWTLDGWGGVHAFGSAPRVSSPAYWAGWDIARAFVVTSRDVDGVLDGRQGYLLDGWGGIHPWGGAPVLSGAPYAAYQDMARGLEIHYNAGGRPDGGWVLDRWGTVTPFGAAPPLNMAGLPRAPIYQQLHAPGSGAFAVRKWGAIVTSGPSVSPYWGGYSDRGAWDILRDVVLIDPTNPSSSAQPVSSAAASRQSAAMNLTFTIGDPIIAQARNLDCESAALRMGLLAKGSSVSEDWILAQMGADLRAPVRDQFGDILRWGDPYQTFVGNVNGFEYNATGYGVYYPPIAMAAAHAGHASLQREGWNPRDLYAEVAAGNPVIVWVPVYSYWSTASVRFWTAWDGRQVRYTMVEHAMTLIGVDAGAGTLTINDPNHGVVRTVSMPAFEAAFAKLNNMAVVID